MKKISSQQTFTCSTHQPAYMTVTCLKQIWLVIVDHKNIVDLAAFGFGFEMGAGEFRITVRHNCVPGQVKFNVVTQQLHKQILR